MSLMKSSYLNVAFIIFSTEIKTLVYWFVTPNVSEFKTKQGCLWHPCLVFSILVQPKCSLVRRY